MILESEKLSKFMEGLSICTIVMDTPDNSIKKLDSLKAHQNNTTMISGLQLKPISGFPRKMLR